MKNVVRFFVYGAFYYYVWLGLHTLLFDFDPPMWVILAMLFLSYTFSDMVVRTMKQIEKENKKDHDK